MDGPVITDKPVDTDGPYILKIDFSKTDGPNILKATKQTESKFKTSCKIQNPYINTDSTSSPNQP
jgi:hypothetical protein